MPDYQAKIIVGASPVGIDQRHTYLLFERSDGSQTVVRGGPSQRAEGNDLANFAESTLLGSDKFGSIRFDSAPYVPPFAAVSQRQPNGPDRPLPIDQANPDDASLRRDEQGNVKVHLETAPDWPLLGEKHERTIVWQGTDQELEKKLNSALTAGQQINDAKLEYSPLYNNSNGVTSTLLNAIDVKPSLPLGKDGESVTAPNFGENLHQDVGLASSRSGYWFDGKQWFDNDDRKIKPPQSGEPVVPLDPAKKKNPGSFDSSSVQPDEHQNIKRSDMRDPLHPDNPRFQQAYAGVTRIDGEHGRTPDRFSEQLAAALTVQSKVDGLNAVHHVLMNKEGTRAFTVDTPDAAASWAKRSSIEMATAVQQPVEVSNEKIQQVNQQIALQQQNSPSISPDDPIRGGPRMV